MRAKSRKKEAGGDSVIAAIDFIENQKTIVGGEMFSHKNISFRMYTKCLIISSRRLEKIFKGI
jgi:hypothetical protein